MFHSLRNLLLLTPLLVAACDLGQFDGSFAGDAGVGGDPGGGGPLPDAGFALGCNASCHGDEGNPAPPRSLDGTTDTTARGVGAHRAHLNPTPTWHRAVSCGDCHDVPAELGSPGHMDDGDNRAELAFSGIARNGGASPSFDGATCSSVYCHGSSLSGGALTAPDWTVVDDSQDACGNCHGFPPPPPHAESDDCGTCHPTVQPGTIEFLDPNSHINGVLEVGDGAACDSCHGSGGVAAPPKDLDGNTARTSPGVGAHRNHLGPSSWHRELSCVQCHVVPTDVSSPGHIDGDDRAELTFDALNPLAVYDAAASRCDNLYCHGNGRASVGTMTWTSDPTLGCSSCHATTAGGGAGLQGDHGKHFNEGVRDCSECHQAVVDGAMEIVDPNLHLDGLLDVKFSRGGTWNPAERRCSNLACHGAESW